VSGLSAVVFTAVNRCRTRCRERPRPGLDRSFCCAGCRAAAELIGTLGLEDFYRFAPAPPLKPVESSDNGCSTTMRAHAVAHRGRARGRAVSCYRGRDLRRCGWLITPVPAMQRGVRHVSVNTATAAPGSSGIPPRQALQLLRFIEQLGYPQIVGAGNGIAGQGRATCAAPNGSPCRLGMSRS